MNFTFTVDYETAMRRLERSLITKDINSELSEFESSSRRAKLCEQSNVKFVPLKQEKKDYDERISGIKKL